MSIKPSVSHFRDLLDQETEKLNKLCSEWESILDRSEYPTD